MGGNEIKCQGLHQTDGSALSIFLRRIVCVNWRRNSFTKCDSWIPGKLHSQQGRTGKGREEGSAHELLLGVLLCLIN